jgi:hypothetical protein
MKKIGLLLIFSLWGQLKAQSWNTFVVGDTVYYSVKVTGMDSNLNGYLRVIFADSSISASASTTNYFYPSIRLDANGIIDTATGDTWLGKKNIRFSNGDELYFNQIGDSIYIKTMANLGDTWTFCGDSNGITYQASVTSLGTLLIDGVLDSIKTIQLQAFAGTTATGSIYNAMPVILSKAHGFYTLFEFYGFPYHVDDTTNFYYWPYEFPFPYLPMPHRRVDKEITLRNFKNIDLAWKYKPANEWQTISKSFPSNPNNHTNIHDSILSVTFLSPDTAIVSYYSHVYSEYAVPPTYHDTSVHSYATITDTFYNDQYGIISGVIPEHKSYFGAGNPFIPNSNYGFFTYFIDSFCNRLIFRDSSKYQTSLSGNGSQQHTYLQDFGLLTFGMYSTQTSGGGGYFITNYLKLDSCERGTKINFKILSTNDGNDVSNHIVIYPNPASNQLHVDFIEKCSSSAATLYSMQGEVILSSAILNQKNSIDISQLSSGVYLLQVKTTEGTIFRKVVKE